LRVENVGFGVYVDWYWMRDVGVPLRVAAASRNRPVLAVGDPPNPQPHTYIFIYMYIHC
jgi:hypothetical protein